MRKVFGFKISDQQPVVPEKKGIVVPASFAESAQHLRPNGTVPPLIFL
jgi:hypothetical protein